MKTFVKITVLLFLFFFQAFVSTESACTIITATKKDLTPEFMASVLKATHQTGKWKTTYSAVYDLQELRLYLYYNRQFHKPYILDVEKELDKMAPHRYFSLISLKELVANLKIE